MSTTVVTPPAEAAQEFDVAKYMQEQNERDEAARIARTTPPAIPAKAEPAKEEPKVEAKVEEAEAPKVEEPTKPPAKEPRSGNLHDRHFRRMLRDNALELGRERTLREQLEARLAELEKSKGGDPAKSSEQDPEPQRADFASDAEFLRAAGRWDARLEARKEFSKAEAERQAARSQEQYVQRVAAMDEKAADDRSIFDDWDDAVKEAQKSDALKFTPTQTMTALFETSNVRSAVLYYLCKHPNAMKALEAHKENAAEQIQEFRRIEGRAETLYNREAKKQKEEAAASEKEKAAPVKVAEKAHEPPRPTAAELDAKKPQPTAAITPKGGSTPDSKPSPFLEDGVTINPVWLASRNANSQR